MSSAAPISSTPLACPDDHTFLEVEPGALACPSCGRRFPLEDRIADFMDAPNDFYEGAYRNEVRFLPKRPGWLYELPLWLVSNGYVWAVRRFLPPFINSTTDAVKGSALVSLFGVVDLMMAMQQVIGRTYEPMPLYLTGAAIYFVINYSLSQASRRLEQRYAYIRD